MFSPGEGRVLLVAALPWLQNAGGAASLNSLLFACWNCLLWVPGIISVLPPQQVGEEGDLKARQWSLFLGKLVCLMNSASFFLTC